MAAGWWKRPGGNALWSALGARMAGLPPRVLAVVGSDYPPDVLETLSASGIDTSAIVHIDRTHPVRVTFAHLADGSRIQPVPRAMIEQLPASVRGRFVDTTVSPQILQLGAPTGSDVPSAWLDEVDAWHLPLLPLHRHRSLVERIAGGSRVAADRLPGALRPSRRPVLPARAYLARTRRVPAQHLGFRRDRGRPLAGGDRRRTAGGRRKNDRHQGRRRRRLRRRRYGHLERAGLLRCAGRSDGGGRCVLRRVPRRHGADGRPPRRRDARGGSRVLRRGDRGSARSRRNRPRSRRHTGAAPAVAGSQARPFARPEVRRASAARTARAVPHDRARRGKAS